MLLLLHLDSVPALDVLLNLHPHNVSVNGQCHLVSHRVNLSLLGLDGSSHLIKSLLKPKLKVLLSLHLLIQSPLEQVRLRLHLLIMALKVCIQSLYLLLLGHSGLQMTVNCS